MTPAYLDVGNAVASASRFVTLHPVCGWRMLAVVGILISTWHLTEAFD